MSKYVFKSKATAKLEIARVPIEKQASIDF
jgi:hypothetical protein